MYKRRYRLGAVYNRYYNRLEILPLYRYSRYKKQYEKMKKDLLDCLGISDVVQAWWLGGIIINRKRKNNIPEKILLFCILFLSYRWIFEDDRFTFGVAFWGYLALTGWVFRCGETPDQDISSESVDENPLYVYGMMRKNRKWLSGIRGCFLFQMLLLTDVFFAAVYSCWKCWTNSSGNDAIE